MPLNIVVYSKSACPQCDTVKSLLKAKGLAFEEIKIDDEDFVLTATIGIARYSGEDVSAEMLLKNASIALYEARRKGGTPVELFNPSMVDERAELVILEAELRRAVERGEFEVHYQPIARLADMQLAGFEALVRWRHPEQGMISPGVFIPVKEQAISSWPHPSPRQ